MRVPGPLNLQTQGSAVVKARYSLAGTPTSAGEVNSSARRCAPKPRREVAAERETFSKDQRRMSREEITTYLNRADAEHAYHYRVVITPGADRNAEGVDLNGYTRRVVAELEQLRNPVSWVAVAHVDEAAHGGHAHIHLFMSVDTTFSREEFQTLRSLAERIWHTVRRGGEENP